MAQIINFNEVKNKKHKEKENERCNDILKNLKEKRKDFTTTEINRIAEDILKALDFYNIRNSTPIIKITRAFGITPYKEILDIEGKLSINGTTKDLYGQDKVIVINKKSHLYVNRFVVARQLAVFIFNFKENDGYKNKEKVFIDIYNGQFCKDYERFATEILMPKEMFIKQHDIAVEKDNRRIFVIMYLSRYFEVPEYFVERRIYELTH